MEEKGKIEVGESSKVGLDFMAMEFDNSQEFVQFTIISTFLLISFLAIAFIVIVWCCHPSFKTKQEAKKQKKPKEKPGKTQEMTKIIPYGE